MTFSITYHFLGSSSPLTVEHEGDDLAAATSAIEEHLGHPLVRLTRRGENFVVPATSIAYVQIVERGHGRQSA